MLERNENLNDLFRQWIWIRVFPVVLVGRGVSVLLQNRTYLSVPAGRREPALGGGTKAPRGETPEQGSWAPLRALPFQLKQRLFKKE